MVDSPVVDPLCSVSLIFIAVFWQNWHSLLLGLVHHFGESWIRHCCPEFSVNYACNYVILFKNTLFEYLYKTFLFRMET